jgi:hypothetical protein
MIMPRLAFEEPKGGPLKKAAAVEEQTDEAEGPGRHRRDSNRDTVLVILKGATVAVAIALVGVIILLTTAGGDGDAGAKAPAVPDIPTSHTPSSGPTTTTPLGAMVAPEVRTQTTAFVPSVPPPVTEPTLPTAGPPTPPGGGGGNQFVRVGDKCDTPGAVAVTERYEPVVCDGGRGNNRLTWRRMFR